MEGGEWGKQTVSQERHHGEKPWHLQETRQKSEAVKVACRAWDSSRWGQPCAPGLPLDRTKQGLRGIFPGEVKQTRSGSEDRPSEQWKSAVELQAEEGCAQWSGHWDEDEARNGRRPGKVGSEAGNTASDLCKATRVARFLPLATTIQGRFTAGVAVDGLAFPVLWCPLLPSSSVRKSWITA